MQNVEFGAQLHQRFLIICLDFLRFCAHLSLLAADVIEGNEIGLPSGHVVGIVEIDHIGFYSQDGQIRASAIAYMGPTVPERAIRIDPQLLGDAARRMKPT